MRGAVKRLVTLCLVLGAAAAAASSAFAAASANWSGYVATAPGAAFSDVVGSWVQPTATCSGRAAYSAFWVGLGGASTSSQALEQIGSSADCEAGVRSVASAWYEIIPAPPVTVQLAVAPGDALTGEVTASGTAVTLTLRDVTRGTSFAKSVTLATPDLSSAEWIAEAPSQCGARGRCTVLPLANFGTVAFSAGAATANGHAGAIGDAAWTATATQLVSGRTLVANPSALAADGASFSVAWQAAAPPVRRDSRGWGWGRHR